ncbi:MAG: secretin N-terminal domain-containing protein, partial [Pseudomonadota bacterium]
MTFKQKRLCPVNIWKSVIGHFRGHAVVFIALGSVVSGCVQSPKFEDSKALKSLISEYAEQSRIEEERQVEADASSIRALKVSSAPSYSSKKRKLVSVDLVNAPLGRVIGEILVRSAASYNLSGVSITGRVTAKFKNLPLMDALNQLLSHRGLGAYKEGDVIRLRYGAPIKPARTVHQGEAKTEKAAHSNKETQTPQVVYEEVPLRHVKMEDTLKMLQAVFQGQTNNIKIGTLPERNAIYLAGHAEAVSSARAVIARADQEVPHVLIEALVVAFSKDDAGSFQNSVTNAAINNFSGINIIPGQTAANITFTFLHGVKNTKTLSEILDIYVAANRARILSRPYMTARSRETAKIEIVQEAFTVINRSDDGASVSTNESISAGVTLRIVPTVQSGNTIRLQINIEDSDFISGPIEGLLAKRRNTAQTSMNAESGQTIVIGGLNRSRSGASNTGLPWVRNIPGLNFLTSQQQGLEEGNQVVVYLTPRVWKPDMKPPVAQARELRLDSSFST